MLLLKVFFKMFTSVILFHFLNVITYFSWYINIDIFSISVFNNIYIYIYYYKSSEGGDTTHIYTVLKIRIFHKIKI